MKILTAEQTRALDSYTIDNEPISSIDLMERASQAFVRCFCDKYVNTRPVALFCGKGNNGGDGLAIARLLSERSFSVSVYIVQYTDRTTEDFDANYERLLRHLTPGDIQNSDDFPTLPDTTVCIDALLGSGLSRPAEGLLQDVIYKINTLPNRVVSVDIASGLYADKANAHTDTIIEPDCTITFQMPKLAFLLPQNARFVGEWHLVDIGLSRDKIRQSETSFYYTDREAAEKLIKPRGKFSHKGTFGHALLLAGSYGKMGAAVLAGRACLRSGVGLLTMQVPRCGYEIIQISVPEAMAQVDLNQGYITSLPDLEPYAAIGIGPGIGKEPQTAAALESLLQNAQKPLLIDADALNLMAENDALRDKIPINTILTPHPKEFERLAGKSSDEFERLQIAQDYAKRHKVIICLKGANTAVVLPNREVHFNSTGNPGMSTGGTGDVLSGIITALLAQGYEPHEAAILGVYQHGLAGDYAALQRGQSALIASDVVEALKW